MTPSPIGVAEWAQLACVSVLGLRLTFFPMGLPRGVSSVIAGMAMTPCRCTASPMLAAAAEVPERVLSAPGDPPPAATPLLSPRADKVPSAPSTKALLTAQLVLERLPPAGALCPSLETDWDPGCWSRDAARIAPRRPYRRALRHSPGNDLCKPAIGLP